MTDNFRFCPSSVSGIGLNVLPLPERMQFCSFIYTRCLPRLLLSFLPSHLFSFSHLLIFISQVTLCRQRCCLCHLLVNLLPWMICLEIEQVSNQEWLAISVLWIDLFGIDRNPLKTISEVISTSPLTSNIFFSYLLTFCRSLCMMSL